MDSKLFFEDTQSEKRERLFLEFNTLSVVYGRPSEKFLKDKALKQSLASEKKYYPKERGFKNTSEQDKLLIEAETPVEDLLDIGASAQALPKPTSLIDTGFDLLGGDTSSSQQVQQQISGDLLGSDTSDLFGFGGPGSTQYSLDGMMGSGSS